MRILTANIRRALQPSGGQRDGVNLNILNDKERLLLSGCICRIRQDLLQRLHTQWEDRAESWKNAASRLRLIMRHLKML